MSVLLSMIFFTYCNNGHFAVNVMQLQSHDIDTSDLIDENFDGGGSPSAESQI
jgi:hypothetical protein